MVVSLDHILCVSARPCAVGQTPIMEFVVGRAAWRTPRYVRYRTDQLWLPRVTLDHGFARVK